MSNDWKSNPKEYVAEVRNHLIQSLDGYGLCFGDVKDWEYGSSFHVDDLNLPKRWPEFGSLPESGLPKSLDFHFDKEKDTAKVSINDWNGYMGSLGNGSFRLDKSSKELGEIYAHNILALFKKFNKPLKENTKYDILQHNI